MLFPILEAIHVMGLALSVGTIVLVDLWLLGWCEKPIAKLASLDLGRIRRHADHWRRIVLFERAALRPQPGISREDGPCSRSRFSRTFTVHRKAHAIRRHPFARPVVFGRDQRESDRRSRHLAHAGARSLPLDPKHAVQYAAARIHLGIYDPGLRSTCLESRGSEARC